MGSPSPACLARFAVLVVFLSGIVLSPVTALAQEMADAGATGQLPAGGAPSPDGGTDSPKGAPSDPSQGIAFDTPEAIRDYALSVGDTLAISLWATDLRLSQTFTIPFEGKIYVPSLGEIAVNRRTTEEIKAELLARLGNRVKGLRASVLLVQARPISVFVTGMVRNPGLATIPVLSRLSGALAQVGGILPEGSQRRITIARGGQKVQTVDLYRFMNQGELKANPRLQAGDVINVPPLGNQVLVQGAVYRPGQYETLNGETIADALALAHGTTSDAALGHASIAHQLASEASDRKEQPLDLSTSESRKLKLQNRDRLYIPTNTLTYIPMPRTKALIQGLVNKEGTYTLTVGQTLRDLFAQAGGPKPDAGLREVAIYHEALSGGTAKAPARVVNAYKLLYENDESQNVELQDGDLVMVPSNKLPIEDSVVHVHGVVGKPGRMPYRVGARLSDYLNAAGGPLEKADLRQVRVTRSGQSFTVNAQRVLREGLMAEDQELQPGDIVTVPEAFFYISNFQDVVNTLLAAVSVYAVVRPLIGK